MCGPCKRKSGQSTQQPPPLPNTPLRAEELSPASINTIRATINLPHRLATNTSRFQTPAQILSNRIVPTPSPVSRPIKQSAPNPPKSSGSTPTLLEHAEVYRHGESTAKRVRMDRIDVKNEKNTP
ncbi:uncharacterized protein MELLADRAFT_65056 [Melampsora larici-populina 98AG31]|uniref:Uncharacterized protein n=1 Tax=Melampsora larici-populina (strain 98AG31 / pathotype 3-4-7) TaxID=747676 RepID=F4RTU1_MELLP|nr:uncharacterized protein MELLADRAFT_65056 [Melampsora larici-populina 98AG31]EGG04199.1 hypothetical protein MELLADRAFT_65056 [Melampsora larici-populina 98AG31]